MSIRINISMSEEFRDWLKAQAKLSGLSLSAFIVLLLHEAKQMRDLQSISGGLYEILNRLSPDQFLEVFRASTINSVNSLGGKLDKGSGAGSSSDPEGKS